jgi:glycosyltransferase involved in cell wall biosynthesis
MSRIVLVMRLLADRHGGAERVFGDLANLLDGAGHQVIVAHYDARSGALPRFAPGIERVNLRAGATAGRLALGRRAHFTARLAALFRAQRPDLVISFLPPANTPALLAGRLTGTRVVPTNHNVPEQDYRSRERWSQSPIDRRLRLAALRFATRIHVLFPSFAAWFPPALREKIVAIPNGVSPEIWTAWSSAPRRREIVAAGRLAPVKAYATLIDAWALIAARHPDWSVVIAGDGPEAPALRAQIVERGVAASCRLAGRVPDIARLFLEAEIMAHPARFEGFGLAVAEAIACGAPPVAFADCAGVNEIVKDDENGLLVDRAGGAAALAAGLERLIDDAALRERLRAAGRASIATYAPDAFRDRWLALVDEVAAAR